MRGGEEKGGPKIKIKGEFDLIIVGGGSVGQAVADLADQLGLRSLKVTDRKEQKKPSDVIRPAVCIPQRLGTTVGIIGKKIAKASGMKVASEWAGEFADACYETCQRIGMKEIADGFLSFPVGAHDYLTEAYNDFEDYRLQAISLEPERVRVALSDEPKFKFVVSAAPSMISRAPRIETAPLVVVAIGPDTQVFADSVQPGQVFSRAVAHRSCIVDTEAQRSPIRSAFPNLGHVWAVPMTSTGLMKVGETFESGQPDNVGPDALYQFVQTFMPDGELKSFVEVVSAWPEEPTDAAVPTVARFGRQGAETVFIANYGNQGLELSGGLARDALRRFL